MRWSLLFLTACASRSHEFPMRDLYTRDTDLNSVSVHCRKDPDKKDPNRQTCAPESYDSPGTWDVIDNIFFRRVSDGLTISRSAESVNVNAFDEVPDSSWFTNVPRNQPVPDAPGACTKNDLLEDGDKVADGAWVIDHGKDNGTTLGFRVAIEGKGQYMIKADDPREPEQASAAAVTGEAFFHELGFNTTCEQVVNIRKGQLKLSPGLSYSLGNDGPKKDLDDAALDLMLKSSTKVNGGLIRMQASKWLTQLTLGPWRYISTRGDDPNDVIPHEDRRDVRGMKLLNAWMSHWDSREQNTMDVWQADDPKNKRSSPGKVMHYILDTSDAMGALGGPDPLARRLGYSYIGDWADIGLQLITFGFWDAPWDRAQIRADRQKFGYFRVDDFDPENWKGQYPNPAFQRMTERDGAWMARLIARFSRADIARIIGYGKFTDPSDAAWLVDVMVQRQHIILSRYLTRLSPLGEIRNEGPRRICATDFARLRLLHDRYEYTVTANGQPVRAEAGDDGALCFDAPATGGKTTFKITNGTAAAPILLHAFDLGDRGMRVVGVTRPEP